LRLGASPSRHGGEVIEAEKIAKVMELKQHAEKLEDLLRKLLTAANHTTGCKFGPCTCGKATLHSNAQIEGNKYLREHDAAK